MTAPKPPARPKRKRGRPRQSRAYEDFKDVAEPPESDPLALASWAQRVVAKDLRRIVQGRANRVLSQEIRASARAISALMPLERVYQAEQRIGGRRRPTGPEGGELVDVSDVTATPLSGRPPGS